MSASDSQTLTALADEHRALVEEAAEALPHQFSQCTYSLGPIRQAVYLCLTCQTPRGICSACSIACHTNHEQLELFPKRNFRCDCPTRALAHACALHPHLEDENKDNAYGRNFRGVFCRCGRPYDAAKERETMVQCLACEDWFHESCLNLREQPLSRAPTPENAEVNDAASDASSSGLPPALVTSDDYDSFVCGACVCQIPTLMRHAGTPGTLMVMRDAASEPWRIIGRGQDEGVDAAVDIANPEGQAAEGISETGEKRARSPESADTRGAKRPRISTSSPPCLAPTMKPLAQMILSSLQNRLDANESCSQGRSGSLGEGDVFLTEGWRERWCKCNSCLPSIQARPYLLEEEETYEHPEDPDSGLTLEELGLRALQRLPRDQAIDGIRAFNAMRDDLMNHLRPFAQEGREVTEADIRAFFDARTNGQAAS